MMLLANLERASGRCQPTPLPIPLSQPPKTMAGRRVVLFPFPSATHAAAMLQLGVLLHARGLVVTVLHADLNAPDPAFHHPDLAFVSIHESLPFLDGVAAFPDDPVAQAMALNDACEAPFQAALDAELARAVAAGGEVVACAVVDAHWHNMLGAAARAGVPALAFQADGAAAFLDDAAGAARAYASAVVLNTFDAIESPELAMIRRDLSGRSVFAVGPLHLLAPPPPQPDGGGCLAWLDARPPRSVLYVSLGRRAAAIDRAAFVEMAWGLAGSGVPFLWVIPRGGGAPPAFPEELEETARRRGKVVAWSPQREVLAHPSVGGFWTGCGWSSTMEAVCAGVPMLVHPCSGGQEAAAARYVTRRWGTGLEIAGRVVERTAVARTIRRLMARDLSPHAPRERARFLKMQARQCVVEGGLASLAIDELVEYILGL
ncbi:unnamed protein product [Urochloa decumbens]|uniref:Glycosyltransferase n=1 Tax=Urochloa decumbens TaxID=240449 RepID=A0ABC9FIK6_9POAL